MKAPQSPVSLKKFNTFGFDVNCHELHTVTQISELIELYENGLFRQHPKIISGGSNLLLTEELNVPVILNRIKGIRVSEETEEHIVIYFGAGESWHESVLYAVEHNWGGIENLSLIPGCIGAAPIQNIGAYGVELKDVFHELQALDLQTGTFKVFDQEACKFGYRESVFKNVYKNRYFITEVALKLSKKPQIHTQYGDIQSVLDQLGTQIPTIADVSRAVIKIRQSKLPDPAEIGNSGSFFKNPVIPAEQASSLQAAYPSLKVFPQNEKEAKIPAAWLIEQAGWKGFRRGEVGVHEKQALVLVHYGGGKGTQIKQLASDIQQDIQEKFNITLEFEVNIW